MIYMGWCVVNNLCFVGYVSISIKKNCDFFLRTRKIVSNQYSIYNNIVYQRLQVVKQNRNKKEKLIAAAAAKTNMHFFY